MSLLRPRSAARPIGMQPLACSTLYDSWDLWTTTCGYAAGAAPGGEEHVPNLSIVGALAQSAQPYYLLPVPRRRHEVRNEIRTPYSAVQRIQSAKLDTAAPQRRLRRCTGTEMVHWSVSFLQALHEAGGYGSLENPLFSWTWWHQKVVALWASAGWATVCFPMQQYGAPYVKDTLVLHNSPMLHKLDKGHSVTKPEVVLRGKIFYNNEWRWRTSMRK